VGGAYFEEHPAPRALNLLLSQKDSISPIPLEPSIIIIISSRSRRAHLESAYGQSNAERNLIQRMEGVPTKTKKRRRKNLPLFLLIR
jgi:hypothetical protein